MIRGEVRWYKFKAPDKKRPVIILTRDSVIEYLGEVTVAPITRTVRDIPSEADLGKPDGMAHECVINCDHIQTVSKAKIGRLISVLSENKLLQLSRAIRFAIDL